jgi:putative transposase
MSIRKVSFAPSEYYHLYNRGNSKQKIFHDKQDYSRFVDLLYACNSENNFRTFGLNKDQSLYDFERGKKLVSIGAYCIMSNHFHLLVKEKDGGSISKFMQKLSTAYVMYYNKKYKRTGGLFEGKFKSEHTGTDRYLKYVFSYVHLNPVKLIDKDWKEKGIRNRQQVLEYLNKYSFSSFLDYLGVQGIHNKILDKNDFPNYFPSQKSFLGEIFDWLNYKK